MKRLHWAVLAAMAVVMAIATIRMGAAREGGSEPASTRPPMPVRAESLARGYVAERVLGEGTARAVRREFLNFRIEGRVAELGTGPDGDPLRAGMQVRGPSGDKPGQMLARIDLPEANRRVELRKSDLQKARNNLALQKKSLERNEDLFKKGIISETEIEKARNEVQNAAAAVTSAETELEVAKLKLDDGFLRAPFDGIIAYRNVRVGDVSGPGKMDTSSEDRMLATAPMVVIDPSAYEVTLKLPPYEGVRVAEGQTAYITRSGVTLPEYPADLVGQPGHDVAVGAVYSVSPSIIPGSRAIQIKVRTKSHAGFVADGMYVTCRIFVAERKDALLLPTTAVIYREGAPSVFVVDPDTDTVKRRRFRGGVTGLSHIEVLDGLKEGELVVTEGRHRMTEGRKVKVLHAPKATAATPAEAAE
ncbi:MAG: efflux RND transporter periplasmic adaptor subunit [Planctomycetota bacterium]